MTQPPERDEIDAEYRWNLRALFPSEDDWLAQFETAEERIETLRSFDRDVTDDPEALADALELREEVLRRAADVNAYARLKRDTHLNDERYRELAASGRSLFTAAQDAASFLELAIRQLDADRLDAMYDEAPALRTYDHYFEKKLGQSAHHRTLDGEAVIEELSEATGTPVGIYETLTGSGVDFPTVETPDGERTRLSVNSFLDFQRHPDREFRREVYEAFYDAWSELGETTAATYESSVITDAKMASVRRYDSALDAALDNKHVPADAYETLVESVRDNVDSLKRHVEVKQDALGVEELEMWDLYAPMADSVARRIPYEEARNLIRNSVAPLGEAYQRRLSERFDAQWIDVYETAGKRSGCYGVCTYDSHPFVLLNYDGDANSVYDLTHELGHAMHIQRANENQPLVYARPHPVVREVSSLVHDSLLARHALVNVTDPAVRYPLLGRYVERVRRTLFHQTMLSEFEEWAHRVVEEGGSLSMENLNSEYESLKRTYYGKADDRIACEWMRCRYLFRGFYVFQAVLGMSVAGAVAVRLDDPDESVQSDYFDLLAAGSRGYPVELVEAVGVDLASSAPVEALLDLYGRCLDAFEESEAFA